MLTTNNTSEATRSHLTALAQSGDRNAAQELVRALVRSCDLWGAFDSPEAIGTLADQWTEHANAALADAGHSLRIRDAAGRDQAAQKVRAARLVLLGLYAEAVAHESRFLARAIDDVCDNLRFRVETLERQSA